MGLHWSNLHAGNAWSLSLIAASWWRNKCAQVSTLKVLSCGDTATAPSACASLPAICAPIAFAGNQLHPKLFGVIVAQVGPALSWLPLYVYLRMASTHHGRVHANAGYLLLAASMLVWLALIHGVRYTTLAGEWDPSGHIFMVGLQLACVWSLRHGPGSGTLARLLRSAKARAGQAASTQLAPVTAAVTYAAGGAAAAASEDEGSGLLAQAGNAAGASTAVASGGSSKDGLRSRPQSRGKAAAGHGQGQGGAAGTGAGGSTAGSSGRSTSPSPRPESPGRASGGASGGDKEKKGAVAAPTAGSNVATTETEGTRSSSEVSAALSLAPAGLPRWFYLIEAFLWLCSTTTALFYHSGSEVYMAWLLCLPAMAITGKVYEAAVLEEEGQVVQGQAVTGQQARRAGGGSGTGTSAPPTPTPSPSPLQARMRTWWKRVALLWGIGLCGALYLAFSGTLDAADAAPGTSTDAAGADAAAGSGASSSPLSQALALLTPGVKATLLEAAHDVAALVAAHRLIG